MAATDTPTAPPAPTANPIAVVRPGDHAAHGYCMVCKSRRAWCGYVRPTSPRGGPQAPSDKRCVVCLDLRRQPCPTCGAAATESAT